MTRSRLARSGGIASAGVLLSAGLFGAYTGNPRIQRAYASPTCTRDALATDEATLVAALDDSTVTCIEIQGTISLQADLPSLDYNKWNDSVRETEGLTVYGSGDDSVDGNGNRGIQVNLGDGGNHPTDDTVNLAISDLTMTDFGGTYGAAVYVYLKDQVPDAHVTLDRVDISDSSSNYGAAFYAKSTTSNVYAVVTDSNFDHNQSLLNGGALYVLADDTAVVDVGSSTFTHNSLTQPGQGVGLGGAVFVKANAHSSVVVDADAYFAYNESTNYGGAIYVVGSIEIAGTQEHPAVFAHNDANWGGAIYSAVGGGDVHGAVFEDNTALIGGGALYSGGPLSITQTTISANSATLGGGVWSADMELRDSSVVDNVAQQNAGGLYAAYGASVTVENSFIGGNVATGLGGGIYAAPVNSGERGDVTLSFTTMYDDTAGAGATEILARNINATMSAVGSSTSGDIWELAGSLDDTGSVSTSDDTQFDGNVAPGSLDLGPRTGTLPGALGRTPNPTSPLAVNGNGGFATPTNPLPAVALDQLGVTRVFPFTVGARQAIVAPSVTSVSPATGPSAGGTPVAIHGTGFTGATTASIGGTAVTSFLVVDDTTITGVTPAGSTGPAAVTVTNPAGINTLPGGFTFISPNPPAPQPASAPRDVTAVPGLESATVTWLAPESSGSFPISSYRAEATPGGRSCVAQAPGLSCTITGLASGTTYTVTVQALTGAGWGATSAPSAAFTPSTPSEPAIVIAGLRPADDQSVVRVDGTTTGLVGEQVSPYVKLAGQTRYKAGTGVRTVDAQGRFQWQRKSGKKVYVFFLASDARSNRVVIAAR